MTESSDRLLQSAACVDFVEGSPLAELGGRYEILQVIGQGGMSVVYKARHRLMNTDVAVKVLQDKLSGERQHLQRFQIEAKATGKLDHNNVIKVLDFGVLTDGSAYLVMDYATGRSLSDIVRTDGPLTPEAAIPIFAQICSGLQHAHEKGVLHRDLKPSNVIVLDDGNRVKVVDFGIAKLQHPEAVEGFDQKLTATGEVFGSPYYMSPEQCMGQEVDPRSDIYSMGCLMYEVLTGKLPFTGSNVLDTIHKQVHDSAKPLSHYVSGDLAQQLSIVVERALQKDPANRFHNFSELADSLQQISEGRKLKKPLPKRAPAIAIGVALILAAIIAIGFFLTKKTEEVKVALPVSPRVKLPDYSLDDKAFATLAKNPEAISIEVRGNPRITNAGIASLRGHQKIEKLGLEGSAVDNDAFATFQTLPRLHFLSIGNTKINPAGFYQFEKLPSLSEIWLMDMNLNDDDLEKLPYLPNLRILKLDANPKLSNRAVKIIARKCPNLNMLAIRRTGIDDGAIPDLLQMKFLERMRTGGSAITRTGSQTLMQAKIKADGGDVRVAGTSMH